MLINLLQFGLLYLIIWFATTQQEFVEQMRWVVYAAIALLGTFALTFIRHYVWTVPKGVERELAKTKDKVNQMDAATKVAEYMRDALRFHFDINDPYCILEQLPDPPTVQAVTGTTEHRITYRVGLINIRGSASLEDACVLLTDIKGEGIDKKQIGLVSPLMLRPTKGVIHNDGKVTLHLPPLPSPIPKPDCYFDVFIWYPERQEMHICFYPRNSKAIKMVTHCTLELRATAKDTRSCEYYLHLAHNNGQLMVTASAALISCF